MKKLQEIRRKHNIHGIAYINDLEKEVEALEKALKFYADENSWNEISVQGDCSVFFLRDGDSGEIARLALEGED